MHLPVHKCQMSGFPHVSFKNFIFKEQYLKQNIQLYVSSALYFAKKTQTNYSLMNLKVLIMVSLGAEDYVIYKKKHIYKKNIGHFQIIAGMHLQCYRSLSFSVTSSCDSKRTF